MVRRVVTVVSVYVKANDHYKIDFGKHTGMYYINAAITDTPYVRWSVTQAKP